ncbi:MAG: hypothetical protein RIK87_05660 [Fuerstiella sp.]
MTSGFDCHRLSVRLFGAVILLSFGCGGSAPHYHIVVEFPDVQIPFDELPPEADGVDWSYTVAVRSGWPQAGTDPPVNPHVAHIQNSQFGVDPVSTEPLALCINTADYPNGWQGMQVPGKYTVDLYGAAIWVDESGGSLQWFHLESRTIEIRPDGIIVDENGNVLHEPGRDDDGGVGGV